MVLTGTTVVENMSFEMDGDLKGYTCMEEERILMNKIVAKDSLRVTSQKNKHVSKSILIQKPFITGHDAAKALVECERKLRKKYQIVDPDHVFFEGFCATEDNEGVICFRFGS